MTSTATTASIAYIAGTFPLLSETFVSREVLGLRRRGWNITAVSLHQTRDHVPEALKAQRLLVYDREFDRTLMAAAAEMFTHPVRSLQTLIRAVGDAINPGEPTPRPVRLRLVLQAIAAIGLAHRLRKAGLEHIHCHFAHSPTTLGMYAAMQLGIAFSFTGHANDLFARRALLKRKLARARFVACISQWHRDFYEQIQPGGGRYEVIRCGVDIDAFAPVPGGDGATLRILSIGRLVEKKGMATLIAAASAMNKDSKPIQLTIAGDGPLRDHLRKLAGQGDWIQWLGPVDNARVPALLAKADVFALPCHEAGGDRDGIPVVLMEAMACCVPTIGGDLPAIAELIENGVSGLLVPGSDAKALRAALDRLAGDRELRRRLGLAGRTRVMQEFSLSQNLDRLETRLKSAIGAKGVAR